MIKPKAFQILAAVTVLFVVAAVISVLSQRSNTTIPSDRERVFPGLVAKVNEVAHISITSNKAKFTVTRIKNGWGLVEKGNYPVKFEKVKGTIIGLAELKLLESKTSDKSRYERLEVEDPGSVKAKSRRVVLKSADDKVLASAIIGKRNPSLFGSGGGGTYLRKNDEARSWLAEGEVDIGAEPNDWLDRMIVDVSESDVKRVSIRQPEGARISIHRADKDQKDFTVDDVPAGRKVDSSEANGLAGGLWRLSLEDVKPASQFKFPKKFHVARYATFDGLTVTVEIAMVKDVAWGRFRASAEPAGDPGDDATAAKKVRKKAAEITARAKGWVYELSAGEGERLTTEMKTILEKPKES